MVKSIKKWTKVGLSLVICASLVLLPGCGVTNKSSVETTTVYGQVTKVSGSTITVTVGTKNSSSSTQSGGMGTPPAKPEGDNTSSTSSTTKTTGSTSSTSTTSGMPQGQPPQGQPPQEATTLTLSKKILTLKITDTSILSMTTTSQSSSGSSSKSTITGEKVLSSISKGTILKITYKSSVSNLVSVSVESSQNSGGPGGTPPGGNSATNSGSGTSSTVNTGTGATTISSNKTLSGTTYTSTKVDQNALRITGSSNVTANNITVQKTAGAASSNDASSFYGLNSAVLALGKSVLNMNGGTVTSTAEGANGVFAYDGATVNIKNTKVKVTGGNAGGIEVAGGGTMVATNLTVFSKVKAAIRSDRGGGTMNVKGGSYTTSGSAGAPAIYSTAKVAVSDAKLTAKTSEAVVVEGMNSVSLNNCKVSGNMEGTYGSSTKNIHNVMLYQSMSGDAETGSSSFTMNGGSLTSKNGDMFYITNTTAKVTLKNVKLKPASGTNLLVVSGNDGSNGWGTAGSNGGDCTFTAIKQTLKGTILVDKISKLNLKLTKNSTYTGAINANKTTASSLSVTLDSSSKWTLTKDSYITEFNGSLKNVNTNGHTLYVNGKAVKS